MVKKMMPPSSKDVYTLTQGACKYITRWESPNHKTPYREPSLVVVNGRFDYGRDVREKLALKMEKDSQETKTKGACKL